MADKHAVVRLDNVSGTIDSTRLKSVKFYNGEGTPDAIDNAQVVVLTEREGREVYKATAPTATSVVSDLVLIAGVELFYDESRTHYLTEWVNEAGVATRGYKLQADTDCFSATKEAFDGEPAKGKFVGFKADSTKLVVKDTADDKTFGAIRDVEKSGWGDGAYEYFVVDVISPAK